MTDQEWAKPAEPDAQPESLGASEADNSQRGLEVTEAEVDRQVDAARSSED